MPLNVKSKRFRRDTSKPAPTWTDVQAKDALIRLMPSASMANERPEYVEAYNALTELFNEASANDEGMAEVLFQEAKATRLRAKLAGPLRRRNYLKASGEMLKNATRLTEDASLLKEIAGETSIVADLLAAEFALERQALAQDQERLLFSLMGTLNPTALVRYLRDPQGNYVKDPQGRYVEVPPNS
jgi:hypothetical protein